MVQRQCGLDEPGGARRGHGMPDHGLDGTDTDRLRTLGHAEDPPEGGQFSRVPGRGRGPVGFDETERAGCLRVQPRVGPGPLDSQHLPVGRRRQQRRRPPVTGRAAAADHRVYPVTGTFGVGQPLEDDHADTLTDEDAVGPPVEGTDPRTRRQGPQQREDTPERHLLYQMDTADDHGVRPAAGELAHGRLDRDQGRRAGRVQGVGRAVQVEPVGDPGRGQVGHQPDRGLGTVRTERFGERGMHPGQLLGRERRDEFGQAGDQLRGDLDPLVQPGHPGPEVAAAAQHHPGPIAITECVLTAGVRDRLGRHPQGHELVGFGPVHGQGHDPEPGRVEGRELLDETAAPAVDPVAGRRGTVAGTGLGAGVEELRVEALRRYLPDGVHPGDDVVPVGVEVARAGEHRRHPDDRDP